MKTKQTEREIEQTEQLVTPILLGQQNIGLGRNISTDLESYAWRSYSRV
ncbi:hypothetical protein HN695_02205 [Candidatus Woesearchaeota archaeon]|jgi:hypothetical protein|nr:hypothetical protein [Candidatus Woesearchaeota archaeon]MBT5272898.1 hypothetical protein [Candidatus Woesearchaeota archaeon]MBT6041364.1 hypothetical protein [Candidatus Woesearchaeota archaeon]MBT6337247.1 hypothetical protein [Candidatus Woesearchaeota archaeon]MBT7927124.1 hypothetical protein [Candidatus Woesearchaeota archaeon]